MVVAGVSAGKMVIAGASMVIAGASMVICSEAHHGYKKPHTSCFTVVPIISKWELSGVEEVLFRQILTCIITVQHKGTVAPVWTNWRSFCMSMFIRVMAAGVDKQYKGHQKL